MSINEIRDFFKNDIFATEATGIEIDQVSAGYSKCRFAITRQHLNATNTVMGGAIYTLADFAFAVAANYERPLTVTLTSNISFMGVAKGSALIAEAKCIKEGGHTTFYQVTVSDDLDNLVATVSVSGYKK